MLGSLLRQLVSRPGEIAEVVAQCFHEERRVIGGRGLQVAGILKMFQTVTATKRTFICVDALDECVPEHRVVVLESLGQILQGSRGTRIFMTGRSQVRSEVERKLDGAATFMLIRTTEDGVLRFLHEKLRKDTTPDIMSSILEAEIMKSIPEITSETYVETSARERLPRVTTNIFESRFLLASLYIKAILRGTTIAGRRKALKAIKKDGVGLGDAYGVTLERIKAQDEEKTKLAITTLTWVCHSERPLQVDELCHALAVEIGATDFDPENIPSLGTLLDCCQGLIAVDKEASTVRLIHYTVQEYLYSHPGFFTKPHSILAETCLTYLNSQQVKSLTSHSLPNHQSMPFLKYSSRYWGTHANRELSDHARTLGLELLGQYEDHVSAISLLRQVMPPSRMTRIGDISPSPLFSGLHCASFFGIIELVTAIINAEGCEINQRDCTGNTPLALVARNGHVEAAKILLGREGIDPNRFGVYNRTPLGGAAVGGHEGVVKLLLEREDIDPNRPDEDDRTPLACAAVEGHEGVVKLLLKREDVDPNRPGAQDRTPIGTAAVKGHEGVVKLLLEREDIDPNRPDVNGRAPLACAAVEGHERVVKLLLEREDVDPNRPGVQDRTPLGSAAVLGHEGVVKLLLKREDVDPNRPDERDRTPLACAAINRHEGVVKLLLGRQDVDPNHPEEYGTTPLGSAAINGYEGVVKLLLGRGDVDPNRQDKQGVTPLSHATRAGHGRVVKLLQARKFVESAEARRPHPL